MDVRRYIHNTYVKKIKYSLVFFCFLNLLSCQGDISEEITVNYMEGKAVSVSLSKNINHKGFDVFLKGAQLTPVLGDFTSEGNVTTFRPIIPFEAGQTYLLSQGKQAATEFTIQENKNAVTPALTAIYPSSDIVPENLLKMYFIFSEPMQEVGKAIDLVRVTNLDTQEEVSVFLDLPTELWNEDHTQLTLWLDPGRIKTGLIPNKEKGLPLIKDNRYEIKVLANWQSAQGVGLDKAYTKQITVIERDHEQPEISEWQLEIPKVGTKEPLRIYFGEAMDAMLGESVLSFSSASNAEKLSGTYRLLDQERRLEFVPDSVWKAGNHSIIATRYLEDLAGNTPINLFDTKIEKDSEDMKHEKFIESRSFVIK